MRLCRGAAIVATASLCFAWFGCNALLGNERAVFEPILDAGETGTSDVTSSDATMPEDATDGASASAFPTFVGQSMTVGGIDASRTIARPQGIQAGDLLLLVAFVYDSNVTVMTPSGFTLANALPGSGENASYAAYCFYRYAEATEATSYEMTLSTAPSTFSAVILAYRSVVPVAPFDATAWSYTKTNPRSVPILTTSGPNRTIVAMYTLDTASPTATWTPAPGMVERANTGLIFVADKPQGEAGSTGDLPTQVLSDAPEAESSVFAVALAPK